MDLILLFVSLIFGALVGQAAWISGHAKDLGTLGNVATGLIGGAISWLLLEWLDWYGGSEWNLALKMSAIFGYMAVSCVVSGLLLMVVTFVKRRIT